MFVSQAHSFRRQARLSITLSWIGGYTNVVSLLACGSVVSHVTGITSGFARDLFAGSWKPAGYGAFLLSAFFLGSAGSSCCAEVARRRRWKSIYALPFVVEAGLLALFAAGIYRLGGGGGGGQALAWLTGLAAAAMGMQNSTSTAISSGEVRTTHVTGVLTDLGRESIQFAWRLVERQRRAPAEPASAAASRASDRQRRRLALLGSIFCTFALGAGLGAVAYARAPSVAMLPPVLFLVWLVYLDSSRPVAEVELSLIAADDLALPASLAVFRLRKDRDRERGRQRMPNLLAWAEQLPEATRVVVLDLGEAVEIDANAALELRALLARLATQGRRLILAELNGQQFQQVDSVGAPGVLHPDNVRGDLDLAIARGLNLE